MPVFLLPEGMPGFPDPRLAREDGLLAVGGDLSVDMLFLAYCEGIFPWYGEDDPILWWCPHERFIIRPENIHISKSMKKFMKRHETHIIINRDFADTMHRCRIKREFREGTWINDDIEKAFIELYRAGYAASVESYIDGKLAGGLYGVSIGRCFFGESMFSDMENGSKIALIEFSRFFEKRGGLLIDCQFHTDHLESMGGEYVGYDEYERILQKGIFGRES